MAPLALVIVTTDGQIQFQIKNCTLKMSDLFTIFNLFMDRIDQLKEMDEVSPFDSSKLKKSMAYPVNKISSFSLSDKYRFFYSLYKDFYVVLLSTLYGNPYNCQEYFDACARLFSDVGKSPIACSQLASNYSQVYMSLVKILNDPSSYTSTRDQDVQSYTLTKEMVHKDMNPLLLQQNDLLNPSTTNLDHLDMELMLQFNVSIPSQDQKYLKDNAVFVPPLNSSFNPISVPVKQLLVIEENLFGDDAADDSAAAGEEGGFGEGGFGEGGFGGDAGFGSAGAEGDDGGFGFGGDKPEEVPKKKKKHHQPAEEEAVAVEEEEVEAPKKKHRHRSEEPTPEEAVEEEETVAVEEEEVEAPKKKHRHRSEEPAPEEAVEEEETVAVEEEEVEAPKKKHRHRSEEPVPEEIPEEAVEVEEDVPKPKKKKHQKPEPEPEPEPESESESESVVAEAPVKAKEAVVAKVPAAPLSSVPSFTLQIAIEERAIVNFVNNQFKFMKVVGTVSYEDDSKIAGLTSAPMHVSLQRLSLLESVEASPAIARLDPSKPSTDTSKVFQCKFPLGRGKVASALFDPLLDQSLRLRGEPGLQILPCAGELFPVHFQEAIHGQDVKVNSKLPYSIDFLEVLMPLPACSGDSLAMDPPSGVFSEEAHSVKWKLKGPFTANSEHSFAVTFSCEGTDQPWKPSESSVLLYCRAQVLAPFLLQNVSALPDKFRVQEEFHRSWTCKCDANKGGSAV